MLDDEEGCSGVTSAESTDGGDNKIYGHPCVNGKFDTSKCVFSRCADGYYLNGSWSDGAKSSVQCVETPVTYTKNDTSSESEALSTSDKKKWGYITFGVLVGMVLLMVILDVGLEGILLLCAKKVGVLDDF